MVEHECGLSLFSANLLLLSIGNDSNSLLRIEFSNSSGSILALLNHCSVQEKAILVGLIVSFIALSNHFECVLLFESVLLVPLYFYLLYLYSPFLCLYLNLSFMRLYFIFVLVFVFLVPVLVFVFLVPVFVLLPLSHCCRPSHSAAPCMPASSFLSDRS